MPLVKFTHKTFHCLKSTANIPLIKLILIRIFSEVRLYRTIAKQLVLKVHSLTVDPLIKLRFDHHQTSLFSDERNGPMTHIL